MPDESVIFYFALPFTIVGALMALEHVALRGGWGLAFRFGIPASGWTSRIAVELPASVRPASFPAKDNLAPGSEFDRSSDVEARWLGPDTIGFWDAAARNGVNRSGLLVSSVMKIEAARDATLFVVKSYVRPLPWLTLVAVFVSFTVLETTWFASYPGEFTLFKWGGIVVFGGILLASTVSALRGVGRVADEIVAELEHRAKTGTPTVADDPSTDLGDHELHL